MADFIFNEWKSIFSFDIPSTRLDNKYRFKLKQSPDGKNNISINVAKMQDDFLFKGLSLRYKELSSIASCMTNINSLPTTIPGTAKGREIKIKCQSMVPSNEKIILIEVIASEGADPEILDVPLATSSDFAKGLISIGEICKARKSLDKQELIKSDILNYLAVTYGSKYSKDMKSFVNEFVDQYKIVCQALGIYVDDAEMELKTTPLKEGRGMDLSCLLIMNSKVLHWLFNEYCQE